MVFASFLLLALAPVIPSSFASPAARAHVISPKEREDLRFHLENIYNEADLLIQNAKIDQKDLLKEEHEMELLRVYDRIPFEDKISALKKELEESASEAGLKVIDVQVLSREKTPKAPPKELFTDNGMYRLAPEQLVQKIQVRVRLRAKDGGAAEFARAEEWAKTWQTDVLRLIEPEGGFDAPIVRANFTRKEQTINATVFRFRDVAFPRLKLRNPMHILPAWARKNPAIFAKQEPQLWKYVIRAQELAPAAEPHYESRRKFFLESARMDYFLHLATPSKNSHS